MMASKRLKLDCSEHSEFERDSMESLQKKLYEKAYIYCTEKDPKSETSSVEQSRSKERISHNRTFQVSLSLNKNLLIDERRASFVVTGTRCLSRWNV